jgi:hypothetical protein
MAAMALSVSAEKLMYQKADQTAVTVEMVEVYLLEPIQMFRL